jgi:hypothetical protein
MDDRRKLDDDSDSVLARLARIEWLLGDLDAGRHEEIRARRLVVVDASGEERVIITGETGHASVVVRAAGTGSPRTTAAELYVVDPVDGDSAEVGLALVVGGDVVATLSRPPEPSGTET